MLPSGLWGRFQRNLATLHFVKSYSTASKPSLQLVAQLRKLTDVSISKAREALVASGNNVDTALQWLEKDLASTGAMKAAKVEGRDAREGLVSVCVLSGGGLCKTAPSAGGVRAAMIELSCETDFVGRNDLFAQLAADIAHTAAFMSEDSDSPNFIRPCSLDALNDAPLLSQSKPSLQPSSTVSSSVRDLIAKVGEKVSLKRAAAVVHSPHTHHGTLCLRLASYLHGSTASGMQGRIGSLAILALKAPDLATRLSTEPFVQDIERLERAIARQITGFDTQSIRSTPDDETALYNQPFMLSGGQESVRAALDDWSRKQGLVKESGEGGIEVLDFAKWTVGEETD